MPHHATVPAVTILLPASSPPPLAASNVQHPALAAGNAADSVRAPGAC
jgi:hypothetical protein